MKRTIALALATFLAASASCPPASLSRRTPLAAFTSWSGSYGTN